MILAKSPVNCSCEYFGFGFWVFYLGFQYENYDDWSSVFFNTRYLKERGGVLKKWIALEVK